MADSGCKLDTSVLPQPTLDKHSTGGVGDKTSTLPALDKFKYMLATGHVVITQADREATCGRAEVLPHEDKVVLTENPVLIDRATDWTSAGEKITLLRGERRVRTSDVRVPRVAGGAFCRSDGPL